MWPDQVSNPGPLTYESGALPTALRGPAGYFLTTVYMYRVKVLNFFIVSYSLTLNFHLALWRISLP